MNDEIMDIEVTAFGETRTVRAQVWTSERIISTGSELVGRFPTGTKLHPMGITLWPRTERHGRHVKTAATVDGIEYVLDLTLYTHNRNRGRAIGWREEAHAKHEARW